MLNAERPIQNEEVEIRITTESPTMTHEVSPACRRQVSCLSQAEEAGVIFLSKHVPFKSS
jgi:hypothetical protein